MNRLLTILLIFILGSCSFTNKEKKNKTVENKTAQVLSQTEIIESVLNQLKIKEKDCKVELIALKKMPNDDTESILVIPEIVSEGDHFFELNGHILIINSKTGKIINKFFESSETNEWVSDALQMVEISIDTAPYIIQKGKRAFGIKVRHLGSSEPNPYETETISLFIKNEDKLSRVLKSFEINGNSGEWDTNCAGEFTTEKKILIISDNITNEYYNVIVKNKISNSKTFINKQGDCDEKEKNQTIKTILKFENNEYIENVL
jgi:hypothetical protein